MSERDNGEVEARLMLRTESGYSLPGRYFESRKVGSVT